MPDHLRKSDYFVTDIIQSEAERIVREFHYAIRGSNTGVYRHGLFHVDAPAECLGVAWWLPPTKRAALTVSPDWQRVLGLTRLAIDPRVPTNGASFLLGRSERIIRQGGDWDTLLTYADEGQGHEGKIYLAANWTPLGPQRGAPSWHRPDGSRVAVKSANRTRTYAEMGDLGYERGPATRKFKFVKYLRTAAVAA